MKKRKIIGIALIIIGIIALAYTGFNYVTAETVADLGSIKTTIENDQPVQWSPLIGMAMVVAGIVVIIWDRKMLFDIFDKKNL